MTSQFLDNVAYGNVLSMANKAAGEMSGGKSAPLKNHAKTSIVETTQQIQEQLISGMQDLQSLIERDLSRFTQSANGFVSYDNSVVFGQEYGPEPTALSHETPSKFYGPEPTNVSK